MQLVEEGKIDLDELVTEYLPCFTMADPRYAEITIRQLLSHTSGMPDVEDWVAEWRDKEPRYDEDALRDYACSFTDADLLFAPGGDWSYSSDGFETLGAVVAAVSGQSFDDYVREQILAPLGMNASVLLLPDADKSLLTSPHMYDEDGAPEVLNFFPNSGIHAPSSTLLSSVDDMLRYSTANLNRGELDGVRILPASTYDDMWYPYVASPWVDWFGPLLANYGMGWWVGEAAGGPAIGGYGADPGFQSFMALLPDKDMAIVAVVNVFDPDEGSAHASGIGNMVMEELLGTE
jgi:CubicO group peptidase (beta-lactamase class C family)